MSYQADIYAAISSDSQIVGITKGRIYADVADQDSAEPYLVYQIVSVRGETAFDGSRGIEFPTVQFSCWAHKKDDAIRLAAKLNALLDGNTLSGSSDISMIFSSCISTYEADTRLFGEILEYAAATTTNT